MQEHNSVARLPHSQPLADEADAYSEAASPAASGRMAQVTLLLAFAGFLGLGLIASRLGVTWPAIRATFGMPIDAISMILLAQLVGSVAVSASSGRLTAWLNIGVLAAASCGITAVALLGSSVTPSWAVLVALSLLTGVGAGLIEAGLNSYAATHFSARAMNWLHACFGVGATLGLVIMTAAVAGSFGWRIGFAVVGAIELVLAICFAMTRSYWRSPAPTLTQSSRKNSTPLNQTFRLPAIWLGIGLFGISAGAQASAGQWFYSVLTEQRGISEALAGTWISLLWGSLTVGRIVFGFVVQRVTPTKILRVCMAGVVVSTLLFWLNLAPWLNFASIMLLGLAMAPQFPLLISATTQYVGPHHAANGIGLQVAAAGLGGVGVTSFVGVLAGLLGLGIVAPALVVASVLMVVLYELLARHIPTKASVETST